MNGLPGMTITIPLKEIAAEDLRKELIERGRLEGDAVMIDDAELRRLWGKYGVFGMAYLPPDLIGPRGCCG
jgi:hypothetical protein